MSTSFGLQELNWLLPPFR